MPRSEAHDRPETKRGDREGRRRDILRAAADILETSGYAEMNMRAIASRAGVSAGTPYSYFVSKEEIFATLLGRRFDELTARFDEAAGRCATLSELMGVVIPLVTDMQRGLGQHATTWERAAGASSPVAVGLGEAVAHTMAALERAVRSTAARQGLIVDAAPATRALVWSIVLGIANVSVAGLERLLDYQPHDLIELAARMIGKGLIEGS
jgi:AcrR family transcriptional regulator